MKNSHKKINTILREGAMVVLSTIAPFLQGDNYIKLSPKIISYSYIYFTGRKRKLLLHLLRGFS